MRTLWENYTRITQDTAGDTITVTLVPSVKVNGTAVAVIGAAVAPHGDSPHNAATMATMATGSGTVRASGCGVPGRRYGHLRAFSDRQW